MVTVGNAGKDIPNEVLEDAVAVGSSPCGSAWRVSKGNGDYWLQVLIDPGELGFLVKWEGNEATVGDIIARLQRIKNDSKLQHRLALYRSKIGRNANS